MFNCPLLPTKAHATLCTSPLPCTMFLYVTRHNTPFCRIPPLPLCCPAFNRLSGICLSVHMKRCFLRLAKPRRRPEISPSSPARTKRFLSLQAQFSMSLRPGKIFPHSSRRRVVGFLPIRLRVLQPPSCLPCMCSYTYLLHVESLRFMLCLNIVLHTNFGSSRLARLCRFSDLFR